MEQVIIAGRQKAESTSGHPTPHCLAPRRGPVSLGEKKEGPSFLAVHTQKWKSANFQASGLSSPNTPLVGWKVFSKALAPSTARARTGAQALKHLELLAIKANSALSPLCAFIQHRLGTKLEVIYFRLSTTAAVQNRLEPSQPKLVWCFYFKPMFIMN